MADQAIHDSEEEDSDYVVDEKDFEEDEEDDEDEPDETVGAGISARNKSAVDAMWAEMNGASVPPSGGARGGGLSTSKKGGKKGKKKAVKKANKVLAGIFGKAAASSMVSRAGKAKGAKRKQLGGAGGKDAAARVKVLAASRSVEVTEVAKYAGKDIILKKTVTAGSAEHAAATAAKKKAGIDNMLAAIDGPKTISTVTKSSMDWETYKTAEGIEGEMQQATKDGKGYLNKQDFLQRCDVRKFEHELEARSSKRDA